MDENIDYLKKVLKLAKKGLSWTNPNPLVGTVIVKNNRIIGQGYHHQAGFPHAEIEALNSVLENPAGSTLYVNLEPCSTFSKTPPCVKAITEAKIKKVVCCTQDPNPINHGSGIRQLQKTGVEVITGILEKEARKINEAFFTFHEKNRSFVAIKFACSLDGKLATYTYDSKWITNEKARNYARTLRSNYQAILVGINTIISDNPHLGTRVKGKKDPIRIILDPKLKIPLKAQVLRDDNIIIITTNKASLGKRKQLEKSGFTIKVFNKDQILIPELLDYLKEQEIISVLVEGGGKTLGHFLDARIIDKVYAFHAPILIGGKKAVSIEGKGTTTIQQALCLKNISYLRINNNLLTIGYPNQS